jgi:hypothetical protein
MLIVFRCLVVGIDTPTAFCEDVVGELVEGIE